MLFLHMVSLTETRGARMQRDFKKKSIIVCMKEDIKI